MCGMARERHVHVVQGIGEPEESMWLGAADEASDEMRRGRLRWSLVSDVDVIEQAVDGKGMVDVPEGMDGVRTFQGIFVILGKATEAGRGAKWVE